jgi:hypothetical protein
MAEEEESSFKVYEPLMKGSAQRTKEGREDAMKQFDSFLLTQESMREYMTQESMQKQWT